MSVSIIFTDIIIQCHLYLQYIYFKAPDPTVGSTILSTPHPISGQNITIGKYTLFTTFYKAMEYLLVK